MPHVPELQPWLKLWVRVPMPAAACESSPAWGRSCGGDFSLEKMSGHVDLPHRMPSPLPTVGCTLHTPVSPTKAPQGCAPQGGSCSLKYTWHLGCGPCGSSLLLAATGGHLLVHAASSSSPMCSLPTFPGHRRVLWEQPHHLFLLFLSLSPVGAGKG